MKWLVCFILSITFPASTLFSQTPGFVNVAAQTGLVLSHQLGNICLEPPLGSGSAWADYDNDGNIDLFVTNRGGANHLYRNNGDSDGDGLPNFTDVAANAGVEHPNGAAHGAVFIDYDNDGDQDLYVTNFGGNKLFRNQLVETQSALFTDVTQFAGVADSGRAITSAWGDFDGDSYLDFYLTKHIICAPEGGLWTPDIAIEIRESRRAMDHLYHNNGDGTFSDVTGWLCENGEAPCPPVLGLGFAPGWLDYDNDGDLDLYLANDDINLEMYPNVLWRNDGADGAGGWRFTNVSITSHAGYGCNAMGLGIGDYNNDGWLDLAFSNIGKNYLLLNEGDGTFDNQSSFAGIEREFVPGPDNLPSITWGTVFFDYDNDQWLDLLFVAGHLTEFANTFQPNACFHNNRDGTFTDVSAVSGLDDPGNARNATIADFDNDGFVDVFVGNLGEPPLLFHNRSAQQGNTNHWLTVTVEGSVSNRDGIGARLWLTTPDNLTQMREICSGATHGGGDFRAAYFGLGNHTSGRLKVRWPGGVQEDLGMVAAGQKLHLIEPGVNAVTGESSFTHPESFVLFQNYPNPFNQSTVIRYQLPLAGTVDLTIFDILGKKIKTLINYKQSAGSYEAVWDGTDDYGKPADSGLYIYRLNAGEFTRSKKMLLIE